MAAGWPGLLVQQAQCQAVGPSQLAPGELTPAWASLGQICNGFLGCEEWIFTEGGIIQYFSRGMGGLGQKGGFLLCSVCNACVLMHLHPSKRLRHRLPHYSMQNAVSDSHGPKDKKVWEMSGHQNQK